MENSCMPLVFGAYSSLEVLFATAIELVITSPAYCSIVSAVTLPPATLIALINLICARGVGLDLVPSKC